MTSRMIPSGETDNTDVVTDLTNSSDNHDNNTHIGNNTLNRRTINLVQLSLENVTYAPVTRSASNSNGGSIFESNINKRRTTILSDITSNISPYQLSAWMGPSGSGKTSLISVAAGLISEPLKDGSIKINGEEGALPKRLVGVVWQDDLLLSNLTVKETVRFAARLKTPQYISDEEVEMLVEDTLSRLGLTQVQDSLIGDGGKNRGISGGERKRVAVAVELVARPSILLLDEPTSGLDASTAYQLMVTLKDLARMGHAIAVVIHQPRTSIFNMFDNLLLLSKGKVVYEGEPAGVRQFLESCPSVAWLPPETGIADWIMDVVNVDEKRNGGGQLPFLWEELSSKEKQPPPQIRMDGSTINQLKNRHKEVGRFTETKQLSRQLPTLEEIEKSEPKFQSSFWTQLKLLTIRTSRQQRGQRLTRVALLLTCCWIAFTGLAWGHLPDNSKFIYSRSSLLFFLIIAQSNAVVSSSLLIFASERRLLSRERAKKMFGVLPYFIAMTLSDMINSVALPTLNGIIVYWICNLQPTASAFFTFVLILYLTISAAQSTGLFLSVAIPNISVALLLAPLLTLCLMILGGFYMPFDLIHPALAWASWLSMARYGFSGFIINEFGDRYITCDDDDNIEVCPVPGSSVIASYGIEGVWTSVWVNVGMLVAIQFFLRVSTYILLLRSK